VPIVAVGEAPELRFGRVASGRGARAGGVFCASRYEGRRHRVSMDLSGQRVDRVAKAPLCAWSSVGTPRCRISRLDGQPSRGRAGLGVGRERGQRYRYQRTRGCGDG
jgi:hypothetical protein